MLFWFRLIIYYAFLLIPLSHPALMVYSDTAGIWALFLYTPAMALFGYLKPCLKNRPRSFLIWPLMLTLLSIPFLGFTSTALTWYIMGAWAFLSSYLAFHRSLSFMLYPEPFLAAWVLLRLVGFSQSSTQMVEQTHNLNLILIAVLFAALMAQLVLIFFLPLRGRKKVFPKREVLLMLFLLIPLVIGGLSADSARHFQNLIRENTPDGLRPQRGRDNWDFGDAQSGSGGDEGSDGQGMDAEGMGEGQGSNSQADGGEGQGEQGNSLYEVPAEDWQQGASGASGANQQFMVMVVQSSLPTVYMAQDYWGVLDGERGFIPDEDLYLNQLSQQRYLETWTNDNRNRDLYRENLEMRVFSTLNYPLLPYFPLSLEPMVRNETYAPLSYTYRSTSKPSKLIPDGGEEELRMYYQRELDILAPYLEVDLSDEDLGLFQSYLDNLDLPENSSTGILRAIFNSFEEFQYEVGYSEDTRIDAIRRFLFETRNGDCTEFSHSAALLARMAGVPSRVVTGYLAAEDMQTDAHREGIYELQQVHHEMAQVNIMDLYMVTSAHRHAWVQFYLPSRGWVDYEATSYAIPPPPGGNMNESDVVIPQITPMSDKNLLVNLPWKKMGRGLLILIGSALVLQYLRRRISMIRLDYLSRGMDERALKAIYSLLIQRYNGRVKESKDPSLTPLQMAEQWPELEDFARIYTKTLYHTGLSPQHFQENLGYLRRESQRVLQSYSEAGHLLRGLFSLREVR